jgi:CheY-like chemotaxis protein/predicted regulator of Ras-like GTPase activity (Roadblock/LC7/MglB family)
MSNKRILIVDDDKSMLSLLESTLKKLGNDYQVTVASNGPEALEKIQREVFDLVVTDYMMPGFSGIDLVQAIRKMSPGTPVVLMTAYGNSRLRNTIDVLEIDGYITKPFNVEQIQQLVKQAVDETAGREDLPLEKLFVTEDQVHEHLQTLRTNTNALSVLLISAEGRPVEVVGHSDKLQASSVSTLVAAYFLAGTELAKLLGSSSVFKSSYHEGEDYQIYAYYVNKNFLLAVVFGTTIKPGVVWFYARQTAAKLAPLLANVAPV